MAATAIGAFMDGMAVPLLKSFCGEAVTVTRLTQPVTTLSFTATAIKRLEQVASTGFNDGFARLRRAVMTCAIADYPSPREGEAVSIETFPGSGVTAEFRVKGETDLISDGQEMVTLVKEELREFSMGGEYRIDRG